VRERRRSYAGRKGERERDGGRRGERERERELAEMAADRRYRRRLLRVAGDA